MLIQPLKELPDCDIKNSHFGYVSEYIFTLFMFPCRVAELVKWLIVSILSLVSPSVLGESEYEWDLAE